MSKSRDISSGLTELLTRNGACMAGFAGLSELDASSRADMPRAIAIAVALDRAVVSAIEGGPTREYYREYERANRLLSRLAHDAAGLVRREGYEAVPMEATTREVDPVMGGTLLPHKTVATHAGLGWIGKCALLVTQEYGSALRLTTVLTDAEFPTGTPVIQSRCGSCTDCVDLCPAGAPSGEHWEAGIDRAVIYDAYACRDKARQLASGAGIDETICGICIAVCPWTKKYLERRTSG